MWTTAADTVPFDTIELRMAKLRGSILGLDEVLTMSSRLAAFTGDASWEEHYRRHERILDHVLAEAKSLLPDVEGAALADQANAQLVQIERQAFELVKKGKLEDAGTLLFSGQYHEQKEVYSQGMDKFHDALLEQSQVVLQKESRPHRIRILLSVLSLGVLAGLFTALKKSQTALRKEQERLAEANENLAEYARVVSHDMKTPVSAIAGWAQLVEMKERGKLDERSEEYLEKIIDESKRIAHNMDELLLQNLETQEGEHPVTDLLPLLQKIKSVTESTPNVSVTLPTKIPPVLGPPILYQQVFQNLIDNSVKHGNSDLCMVGVDVASCTQETMEIRITDNGQGIPAALAETIFEKGLSLSESGTMSTGLGLAFVKKSIEQLGGTIQADTAYENGACFCLTLCRAEQDPS